MALAAKGQNLALVWHKGVCQGRDQNLGVAVWDMAEQTQAWSGSLPLSPGATLTWLGFSEAGMLAAYDSQVGPELGGLYCRLGMRGTCFPQMGLEGTMLILRKSCMLAWLGVAMAGMLATYDSQVGPVLGGL